MNGDRCKRDLDLENDGTFVGVVDVISYHRISQDLRTLDSLKTGFERPRDSPVRQPSDEEFEALGLIPNEVEVHARET